MSGRARGAIRRTRLRVPVKLKLAVVSAALTFVILLLFALVVGTVTERRVVASFDDDLRATAADLQERLRVREDFTGSAQLDVDPEIVSAAAAGGSVIRVVDRTGRVLYQTGPPDLGLAFEGVRDIGAFRVAARPLFNRSLDPTGSFGLDSSPIDGAVAYVQYAKPRGNLQSTVARLHLFFVLGVLGGTALAFLAGFAVARRAMRPIAGLTRAAREVARTRDPARTLPKPQVHDEVAELALTLEEMLRELDAAHSETESALVRQRQFVADASHELRTPLTSILANLELLEEELERGEGPRDREGAAEVLDSALRSSRRMRRLVGDLLLLARADAGREAPRRPVDVAATVRDAVAEAAPLANGHDLTLDLPSDAPLVEGSADDLHRLVLNLVENAFVHTPPGTPVVVSLRALDGDLVRLEVADRGPGIPAAQREDIFERFARHGRADRAAAPGSGLGLSIVRAVAESHGGSVEAGDAEGGGAVLAVTLPAGGALRSPRAGVSEGRSADAFDPKGA